MSFDYWKWHRSLSLIATGFLIPLMLIGYGFRCLWLGEAWFPADRGLQVDGIPLPPNAVSSLAAACIALGLFFHVHFFWVSKYGAIRIGTVAEKILAAVFLPCFAYAFYRAITPY